MPPAELDLDDVQRILAQVAPLFVLGVTWRQLTTGAALAGLPSGTAVYVVLLAAGEPEPWNVHAGVVALGVNLAVCVACTLAWPARAEPAAPSRGIGTTF